jgi:hypothetical protein
MIETRRREALKTELRHTIETMKQKADEDSDQFKLASCALKELDRNDPSLDVNCNVCNCLETFKIARELGYSWDEDTSMCAARYCTVDVMAYLHENGCPWDEVTFASAAAGGHLEKLKTSYVTPQ